MKYIPNTWAFYSTFSLNFSSLDLSFFNRSISLSDDLLFLFAVFSYLYSDSAKASLSFLSSYISLCKYDNIFLPLALKKHSSFHSEKPYCLSGWYLWWSSSGLYVLIGRSKAFISSSRSLRSLFGFQWC